MLHAPLRQAHQVDVVDTASDGYRSTGKDPWFDVGIDLADCRGRWLYIEAVLVRNNGSRVAWLHFDQATSHGPTLSWPITTNLRGSVREVVRVPRQTTRVRWQPTSDVGYFSQSPLLVHCIGQVESMLRRWYRVILWSSRGLAGRSALHAAWRLAVSTWHLDQAYRATADLGLRLARGNDYPAFLARTERTRPGEMRRLVRETARSPRHHGVAIITLLDSPYLPHLRAMVESVKAQWYPHWQLWLVGDPGQDAATQDFLQALVDSDARVRMRPGDVAPCLSGGFAWACESTDADFVLRMGQHDLLRPWALHAIAQEMIGKPLADVIYSDYDHLDDSGNRFSPMFTPEWNPDLLLSQNYLKGMVVFRRDRVVALGGYRAEFVAAEDFDLLLRLSRSQGAIDVRRIARILLSVRSPLGASQRETDDCLAESDAVTCKSEMRAIQDHVAAHGGTVSRLGNLPCYRVQYPLPSPAPWVTAIVPTRDRVALLRACLEGLLHRTNYPHLEVLVVDNGSVLPETLRYLNEIRADRRVRVIGFPGPFNYSAINNHAAAVARGSVLALVNNDIDVIHSDWLGEMVSHALRLGIGAVGAKLLYASGSIQHAGVILGIGGVAGHSHRFLPGDRPGYGFRAMSIQNVSAVTGACLVVRKSVYLEVGGLNEVDLAVAMNDVDFCLRLMEAGYRNLFTPFATLYHHESMSRGRDDTEQKQAVFRKESGYMKQRWGNLLERDPAYNPNLTLLHEDFSF